MTIREITPEERSAYNAVVDHPLQTYEWGEFREQANINVIRRGIFNEQELISGFQLTIHHIPKTPFTIGYLPKGDEPTEAMLNELYQIGKQNNCIFIQLEPNLRKPHISHFSEQLNRQIHHTKYQIQPSAHPLFTKYTFILDLTKSEEELLKNMHPKARYNIRIAQKHNVIVEEDNSDAAFEAYIQLMNETTKRQGFYAHTENYHRLQWQTLPHELQTNQLSSHLFVAKYQEKILTAWIVFVFKDALYYPYGASSSENREVMASNLMMWEVIKFGKKHGLNAFDMWGAMGPDPDPKDPWFGFHNFKQKYGPEHVEFIGSYDLIINPLFYKGYKLADKIRWFYLKIRK